MDRFAMCLALLLGACTTETDPPARRSDAGASDGGADAALGCAPSETACGASCCGALEACRDGRCVLDCRSLEACGDTCCPVAQECREDRCVPRCEPERQCGADGLLCCAPEEACLGGGCVVPGASCAVSGECRAAELCEPTLGRCVPRELVTVCEYRPPTGVFEPVLKCLWEPPMGDPYALWHGVVMTPAVANLTDDNGDGATDAADVPDIVFVSSQRNDCCSHNGILRIASGCDEFGIVPTIASLPMPLADGSGGVALGNLHPDTWPDERTPEIVAFTGSGLVAYRRALPDGTAWDEMWLVDGSLITSRATNAAQPSIADLDADGEPEVILGNLVLDGLTGAVQWDGFVTADTGAGVGHNAFLGPTSTAADIDLDGDMEVIAGNTVYDGATGAEAWTFEFTSSSSRCASAFECDGYNAIGNFDEDDRGEVVAVREGQVYVFEHDGELAHLAEIPDGDCFSNEGGPPTIADFDGDGRAEIGIASADFYVVMDFDCTGDPLPGECDSRDVRWKVPNEDCSSRATGSSVFDFEGDGRAEVIYADEMSFRIFDGSSGAILYSDDTHRSNTRMEMPIVVDVDNDGKSEIVVPEPDWSTFGGASVSYGIQIFEDALNNWVRTRRIWNQHGYHVTNVTEDGQIPRREEPNWLDPTLNNFRQNVQGDGLFDAPDLQVAAVELAHCDAGGPITIAVVVTNAGALGVPPGVLVFGRVTPETGPSFDVGPVATTVPLLPGRRVAVELSIERPPEDFAFERFTVEAFVDDDGTGRGAHNECLEDNNRASSAPVMVCGLE